MTSLTVSVYLSQIIKLALVVIEIENLKKRYYIKARILIDKLIENYKAGLFEESTSGF